MQRTTEHPLINAILEIYRRDLQECLGEGRPHPETKDQKIFRLREGHFKVLIDVYPTHEVKEAPPLLACRHAVLSLDEGRYVVYDRLLSRIVNGVFGGEGALETALIVAQSYNVRFDSSQDMCPNGLALKLHYPDPSTPYVQEQEEEDHRDEPI